VGDTLVTGSHLGIRDHTSTKASVAKAALNIEFFTGMSKQLVEKGRFGVARKSPGPKPIDFVAIIRGAESPALLPSCKT
jgi:hypothetical protein